MERDERVLIMGEDVGVFQGAFKVTEGLLDEFGEKRVRDTPISENTIVGVGVGAAMTGLRPVVEIMTVNFALLAMDMIVNHAAAIPYMFGGQVQVPLVIRMPGGGGHQLGPTHSHSLEAMFLQIPGLLVACPSTPADGKGLLKAAIRDDNPVIFIEHETLYGIQRRGPRERRRGRPASGGGGAPRGHDVTIIGILRMAETALKAADTLANEHGVEAEVIDPRTLRPLDLDTILDSVKKTNRAVVVEEGWPHGGVGANLAALITGAGLRLPRRAGPAGDRRGRPDALLEAARAGGDAPLRARRQRRARDPGGEPLMAEIVMPRLSDSMEEGTILRWLKSVGDEVAVGDELVEIETDKANMVYEADSAGTLTEIVADEGETLAIGEVIARVGDASEVSSNGGGAHAEPDTSDTEVAAGTGAGYGVRLARARKKAQVGGRRKDAHAAPIPTSQAAGQPPAEGAPISAPSSGAMGG